MAAELGRLVDDDARNRNNRFGVASELNARMGAAPGPFWGCPPRAASASLTTTKPPPGPLAEWRTVESVLRERGHRPFSSWQLLGAGAVGSQSLLGIPMVMRLRERFGGRLAVWPFEPADRGDRGGRGLAVAAAAGSDGRPRAGCCAGARRRRVARRARRRRMGSTTSSASTGLRRRSTMSSWVKRAGCSG